MYSILLTVHSLVRWLVVVTMSTTTILALRGYFGKRLFQKLEDTSRFWTVTIAHLQLTIGVLLYGLSPVTTLSWKNPESFEWINDFTFFSILHSILMVTSVVLLTVGSAFIKRNTNSRDKFKTMLFWFGIALIILLIAIPWSFSPFAQRPYFRTF